jgi:CheY-like chemotaxis protein
MESATIPKMRGTILIVDDEEALAQLLCRMVERDGYEAICVSNAAQAVGLYEERKDTVILVITDLVMPGMDGKSLVLELLRRDPCLPILVSTGYSSEEDIAELERAGIRGVVRKPYHSQQLMEKIEQALAGTDTAA